jgi:hypothetical protein
VLLVRRIRELLYEQGFTISGARNRLAELQGGHRGEAQSVQAEADTHLEEVLEVGPVEVVEMDTALASQKSEPELSIDQMRSELLSIRGLLTV